MPAGASAILVRSAVAMRLLLLWSMRRDNSATVTQVKALPGALWGFLGVLTFSFTVPFTRVAVETLPPVFVGAGRAVVAALLAGIALWLTRSALPRGRQWIQVGVVAGGAVLGFPLLTSYALTTASASHSAVVIALLPAATAVIAVLRTGQRPVRTFWLAAGLGALAAIGFAASQGGSVDGLRGADLLLLAAVMVCAAAYAEGGLLARSLGSWQTISWALVLASPVTVALTAGEVVGKQIDGSPASWAAFAYLAVFSMFLGFIVWYRGLAIGPMAQVSQIQLVQPVLSICWAAMILQEHITWQTLLGGLAVVTCALLAVRSKNHVS